MSVTYFQKVGKKVFKERKQIMKNGTNWQI